MNHTPEPIIWWVIWTGWRSWGRKVRARRMGPASSVGKKLTKKAKSVSERVAGIWRRYTSMM